MICELTEIKEPEKIINPNKTADMNESTVQITTTAGPAGATPGGPDATLPLTQIAE